jgi:23S rRNA (cytidine1920-2'-O)/16S rRNA (cytidine1409-2'-O)-methyltransferase
MSQRADIALVDRGFFESRAKARAAIEAGLVQVDGVAVRKPSEPVGEDAKLEASAPHPWVSRAGLKLVAGLDHFEVSAEGRICMDVGSSTGGFTQVLMSRGAALIYAVDVGHGQLHASLKGSQRVRSMEGTDARDLTDAHFETRPSIVVSDVSFISLRLVLPHALQFCTQDAQLVALVKPQFEAGRDFVQKGLVRDPETHKRVCEETQAFVESLGWRVQGIIPSPIEGGDGNKEFLLGATRTGAPRISGATHSSPVERQV